MLDANVIRYKANSRAFSSLVASLSLLALFLATIDSAFAQRNRSPQPQVSRQVYTNPTRPNSPSQPAGSYGSPSKGPSASGSWGSKPGFSGGASGGGSSGGYQLPWKNKAGNSNISGASGYVSSNSPRQTDRKFLSNGIAVLNKEPTPAEKLRGITGKATSDGRAIFKAQDRFYTVPVTRLGVTPRNTQTSQAALATRWTPQQQSSINNDIQKLATSPIGGGSGGGAKSGGVGSGAGKPGITPVFNAAAVQGRIATAAAYRSGASIPTKTISERSDWPQLSDQLRRAAREVGLKNFGVGSATREQADVMGRAWVGDGHSIASDGKTLVSSDKLKQYIPPAAKNRSNKAITGVQANLERRLNPNGPWQHNAHVDITD